MLHIGFKRDVRHPAAAEQAAGALLWFVLAAAKRVRPPSVLDAKLFLLVAPWGPIAFYFLYWIKASLPALASRKEKERNQRSCPQREPTKGVRRQQKGRAGRDRASALKTVPCSAFPGRARLPTAKRGRWTDRSPCCILDSNATLGTRPRRSRLPAHCFGSCSLRRSECGLQARWTRSCSCWSRPGDR